MERPTSTELGWTEVAERISAMHLSRWTEASSHTMIRLVPMAGSSPLGVRAARHLAFDVGLAVAEAAVVPSASLIAGWLADPAIDRRTVVETAIENTRSGLALDVTHRAADGFDITIVSGGLFTTGAVATAETSLPKAGVAPPRGNRWISALSPTTVVVIDEPGDGRQKHRHERLTTVDQRVSLLCRSMAARVNRPLPANVFSLASPGCNGVNVEGSFASVRILE